jgi:hypothetical protein
MHELQDEIEALKRLDLFQLRGAWSERFGPAPKIRSVELFRLMLAWRLQAAALGGLDAATKKALRATGPVIAEGQELGIGATIRRQWQGQDVIVEVVEGGFAWRGATYRSLSAVASAIAGSRWNGPKFFGLRS